MFRMRSVNQMQKFIADTSKLDLTTTCDAGALTRNTVDFGAS